jgi:hypothetical protein
LPVPYQTAPAIPNTWNTVSYKKTLPPMNPNIKRKRLFQQPPPPPPRDVATETA